MEVLESLQQKTGVLESSLKQQKKKADYDAHHEQVRLCRVDIFEFDNPSIFCSIK